MRIVENHFLHQSDHDELVKEPWYCRQLIQSEFNPSRHLSAVQRIGEQEVEEDVIEEDSFECLLELVQVDGGIGVGLYFVVMHPFGPPSNVGVEKETAD